MTHALYSASDNTLKEISQMEKPVKPKMGLAKSSFEGAMEKYTKQLAAYEKYVASLRTLPCHDGCRGLWKEGGVLTEGRDYEIKYIYERAGKEYIYKHTSEEWETMGFDHRVVAFPLVPVKSEDEEKIWDEMFCKYFDQKSNYVVTSQIVANLMKQYTITRKQ